MKIGVVDLCTGRATRGLVPSVPEAVLAVQRQVHEHFAPLWGRDATLSVVRAPGGDVKTIAARLDDFDGLVYVSSTMSRRPMRQLHRVPLVPVGAHFVSRGGVPAGFVFTGVAATANVSWSVLLSHEVLEMLVDPDVNLLVGGRLPGDRSRRVVLVPYEVCDPVQASTYEIDGIQVGNFVTQQYFKARPRHGRHFEITNYLEKKLVPFGVLKGGYYRYFDPHHGHWGVYPSGGDLHSWGQARKRVDWAARSVRRLGPPSLGGGWDTLAFGCANGAADHGW